MNFLGFKKALQEQFNEMKTYGSIFRADVDGDLLWETYLKSFPEGSNPKFRKRTEHDCSCCRAFIKQAGAMLAIKDGELVSLWDIQIEGEYQPVANALASLVKSKEIANIYLHQEANVGTDKNYEQDISIRTWQHLFLKLPRELHCQKNAIGAKLSEYRSTFDVMLRSLTEITMDAVDTTMELIGQNSLYRGEEHKNTIDQFKKLKIQFDKANNKKLFCWSMVQNMSPVVLRIRNTAIGTLLVDLSEGKELDYAVNAFEKKVAPVNYKRPTALVTLRP